MPWLTWGFCIAIAALVALLGGEVVAAIRAWREARKGERYGE